ncbi:hypothetical protein D1007_33026 [Hordeum vulgare]|nr:hypothetical protein D1007_33026 [Hordeum vulgare]
MCAPCAFAASQCPQFINGGNVTRTFEFSVEFLPSKAKLVDGSMRDIKRDTIVKWEVEFEKIDPQEIQSMENRTVRNAVEKIRENIFWGPEQEVSLLRFDNWKDEYVRIENGEEMVDEIDRQDGWASKQTSFHAKLVDLKSDSKVGNTGVDQDAEEGCDGAARVVCIDWDLVQLEDTTDLAIAPMADTEMANFFGIPVDLVDDQDEEDRGESSLPNDANLDACEDVDGQLMKDVADDVDDAHNDEFPNFDDVGVQNEQDLDVWQNEQTEQNVVQIRTEVDAVDVQTEPTLEVVLQIEAVVVDVVQTKPHLDVVVPTKAVLDGRVKKTKRLSELGVIPVVGSTSDKK